MGLKKSAFYMDDNHPADHITDDWPQLVTSIKGACVDRTRQIVRTMRNHPDGISLLLDLLTKDPHPLVAEGIFDSLLHLSKDEKVQEIIVSQVIELIPNLDTATRNSAITFLSSFPESTALYLPSMLITSDPDMQIYALDILRGLNHPDAPGWLSKMLEQELHINVMVSVLERVAEWHCYELADKVIRVCRLYPDEPVIEFAARLTLNRLGVFS